MKDCFNSHTAKSYPQINAKADGVVKTKTRYLIKESDIDTLNVASYLETEISQIQ